MKNFFIMALLCLLTACSPLKVFNNVKVDMSDEVQVVDMQFINDFPIVKVNIQGKDYNFLIDTGAMTAITKELFEELHLKANDKIKITDASEASNQLEISKLPEMRINNVVFRNVGCVIINSDITEFDCLNIQGIVGSTQLSKLFCKLNYEDQKVYFANDINKFNIEDYMQPISFETNFQKSVIIKGNIFNEDLNFTLDTGSSGKISILKSYNSQVVNNLTDAKYVEVFGKTSVTLFKKNTNDTTYTFKSDISFDKLKFENELFRTGKSNLIGNDFLKNYEFIIDWEGKKLYLKQIKSSIQNLESFGFGYRFEDAKATVMNIYENQNIPLKVGDVILSIDDTSFENLDDNKICDYTLNKVEEKKNRISVKIKRDGEILEFDLTKRVFIQ